MKFVTLGRLPHGLPRLRDPEFLMLEEARWRVSADLAQAAGIQDRG